MTRFVVGTNSTETSDALLEYLADRTDGTDEVVVVNSLKGGDETSEDDVAAGEDAIDRIADGLDCEVDGHQYVRDLNAAEDLLTAADAFDADEVVIGIRKRSPTGKVLFGSTAQDVLLSTEHPVVAVPLTDSTAG